MWYKKPSIFAMPLIGLMLSVIIPSGFAQSDITVNTDKNSFSPGEQISITGSAEGPSGTPVAIEIRDADGQTLLVRTVETDENGNFALQFRVPQSAKSGDFTIYANAKIGGQTVSNTRVVSVTTEQTPPGPSPAPTSNDDTFYAAAFWGALIGGIIFAIYAIKKRKSKKKASRDRIDFTAPGG